MVLYGDHYRDQWDQWRDKQRETYWVRAIKDDTGEVIEGTVKWDGIASLVTVECVDGAVRYVSRATDKIERFERTDGP
jgi:hypothetical protein